MINPTFRRINFQAYKPGRSVSKNSKKVIKLSANESALGIGKKVQKVLKTFDNKISKYPDGKFKGLTYAISKKYKCHQNKIICGSGSDEIIQMLCQLFLKKGDEVIVPQYSFLMYRIYAKIVDAKVIYSKENNFKVSIKEILKKVTKKTKIVFLANPNNPTGTYLTNKELIELRKKLSSRILLVVDDAYFEYMVNKDYTSGLEIFKNKKNVFILRTFSKIHGLASLRVGWGYGDKKIIDEYDKLQKDLEEISLLTHVVANQLPYNGFWRAIEYEIQNICIEKDSGIICYSPLAQGLLTGRFNHPDEVPDGISRSRLFSSERSSLSIHKDPGCEKLLFSTINKLRTLSKENNITMAVMSLGWLKTRLGILSILIGCRNIEEVNLNVPAFKYIPDVELNEKFSELTEDIKIYVGNNPDMWSAESAYR